jgi:tetratricopeptide (TPR) repeat protein
VSKINPSPAVRHMWLLRSAACALAIVVALAPSDTVAQATDTMPPGQAVPNNPQYVEHAIACMNERKSLAPALVVKSCDAVIDETIRNLANAYYFRGGATLAQRDYDGAIASFSQAIKLDPMQSEYLTGRAAAYEGKNDHSNAIADYSRVIKLDPKSVYAFSNRGALYQRRGDYARAAADYGEVTRLQPDNLDAWSLRCWVRAISPGQTQQALADCNQALRIKADAADALDTRGFIHLKLGQLDNAIKDYDAALRSDPRNAGSLYGRGLAKTKRGDRDGGAADIAAAKALKPDIAEEFARFRNQ